MLVAAGCAAEDVQQQTAREEVERHVRALDRYDATDVHCTDAAKIWWAEQETDEFTCAVRLADGGCDWFDVRVDRDRQGATVRLAQRDAGCTLGFGD